MAGSFEEILKALQAPFQPWELRKGRSQGWQGDYIEVAVIEDRLDNVVGIENWKCTSHPIDRGVYCEIAIYFEGRGWVPKGDGGGYRDMTKPAQMLDERGRPVLDHQGEPVMENVADPKNEVKSGFTDAFRRAALKWGIGRDLHRKTKRPRGADERREAERRESARDLDRPAPRGDEPKRTDWPPPEMSGGAFFRWAQQQGDDVLFHVKQWGKEHHYPGMLKDWNTDQVRAARTDAERLIWARN